MTTSTAASLAVRDGPTAMPHAPFQSPAERPPRLRSGGKELVRVRLPWHAARGAETGDAALNARSRPVEHELALELQPVKYREEFVEEYWAAWQRQVTREGGGGGGARL